MPSNQYQDQNERSDENEVMKWKTLSSSLEKLRLCLKRGISVKLEVYTSKSSLKYILIKERESLRRKPHFNSIVPSSKDHVFWIVEDDSILVCCWT